MSRIANRRGFAALALAEIMLVRNVQRALAGKLTIPYGAVTYDVNLPDDEPLVLHIETQDITPIGQYANVRVFLQTADRGWTQLTRCDDRMIPCESSSMKIEQSIAPQGKDFYLDLPEGS